MSLIEIFVNNLILEGKKGIAECGLWLSKTVEQKREVAVVVGCLCCVFKSNQRHQR